MCEKEDADFLSKDIMHRIKRARLLALPKPDNGVRPIAMGEVILKLAEILLLQRYEKSLPPLFAPYQYGVMMKSGCEKVIHELTDLHRLGHAILSVDLRNAFNSPSRDDISRCVFGFSTLRPFRRMFTAEYADPSELLFYGADGKFAGVVQSSSGVRQGSPLLTLYFCALMQPILETLAEEFPGIKIFAFIDDINLASANSTLLAKAFDRLRALLTANSLEVAPTKCVWFGGKNKIQLPDLLHDQGIRCEFEIIKILS